MNLYHSPSSRLKSNMTQTPVIYYHSVGFKNPAWVLNNLTIELPLFKAHLKYLAKNFSSISLKESWQIRNGILEPISNPIVITFDDGYLDNWVWAFPLLKKYGLKATIFVSPEFVDETAGLRPNLEDVWAGNASIQDLNQSGFLSWEEMKAMETSGLVSIESHTMSHTKFFNSDKLVGFHHPGADCIYPVGNLYPEQKAYYIGNPEFERLLPYGYPFFEENSSVVARRVTINTVFVKAIVEVLRKNNWNQPYNFLRLYSKIQTTYEQFKAKNEIIENVESDQERDKRLFYEVIESKKIIEEHLNKKVEFLCWPHGDYDGISHQEAIKAGYLATSALRSREIEIASDRFFRIGAPPRVAKSRLLSKLKLHYRIKSAQGEKTRGMIYKIYSLLKKK